MTKSRSKRGSGPLPYVRHKVWQTAYTYYRDEKGARKQVYLGRADTPESWRRYHELGAQLAAGQTPCLGQNRDSSGEIRISMETMIARFLRWAETHYRRLDGTDTGTVANFIDAVRPVLKMYRDEPADQFRPKKLKLVRSAMIDSGLSRTTINSRIGKVCRVFAWAVEEELVPESVHNSLKCVGPLLPGRSDANENDKVLPVPDSDIEAALKYMSRPIAGMVHFQKLTAARPGEVVSIRRGNIDDTETTWLYLPDSHKTAHRGKDRIIPIGPQCRLLLEPFMDRLPSEYLFTPHESEMERLASLRKTKEKQILSYQEWCDSKKRQGKDARYGECYSVASYRQCIRRACMKAGIEPWTPHRLRHTAATTIRKAMGIEIARIVLGVSSPGIAEIYAERDLRDARRAIEKLG